MSFQCKNCENYSDELVFSRSINKERLEKIAALEERVRQLEINLTIHGANDDIDYFKELRLQ